MRIKPYFFHLIPCFIAFVIHRGFVQQRHRSAGRRGAGDPLQLPRTTHLLAGARGAERRRQCQRCVVVHGDGLGRRGGGASRAAAQGAAGRRGASVGAGDVPGQGRVRRAAPVHPGQHALRGAAGRRRGRLRGRLRGPSGV